MRPRPKSVPKLGGANWGSRLVKKTAIFGLPRLLTTPWRNDARARAGAARCSPDRRKIACSPSQIRYAAPANLTASNAGADARSSAAMPALAASAQIAWPTATPPAVRMPLPRPPKSVFRIVSAVSWPGVTMTTAETPRNARTCVITAPSVAGRMLARDGSHLRRHRPARPALHTADRADAESRGPWLRIRLDVRLTHPLAGLLCNVAACCRGYGEDQARPLRYEPGHPRPDHHGQLRSEEHTSELQSHVNLVCRLLLEKK